MQWKVHTAATLACIPAERRFHDTVVAAPWQWHLSLAQATKSNEVVGELGYLGISCAMLIAVTTVPPPLP